MAQPTEQFLGTVDAGTLNRLNWPLLRLLARSFVERLELRRYKAELLASGQWERVRAVPHRGGNGEVTPHIFDLYGVPAPRSNGAAARPDAAAHQTH